jgi:hypothetical protein
MSYNTTLVALLLSTSATLGFYEATVSWEPNPYPETLEMRIYQVTHKGESIAGYSTFPYADLSGTFNIANGCVEVFGRAYTMGGLLSEDSNLLSIPCLCPDCWDPDNPPPTSTVEGHITGISSTGLTFNVLIDQVYDVYCNTNLSSGNWDMLYSVTASCNGSLEVAIDTSQHKTCFYKIIPQ